MSRCFFQGSIRSIVILGLLGAALTFGAASVGAETPRMDDGKPDFSGTYELTTLTPYTRDPKLGEKKTFTKEEVQELERLSHSRVDQAAAVVDPDRDALAALEGEARQSGVDRSGSFTPGSHDFFWFDCGGQYCDLSKVHGEYRTSVIIDPPNGQLPAVTEEGKARRAAMSSPGRPGKYPGEAWWLEEGLDPYGNPEGMGLGDRCIYSSATVPMRPIVYNNMKTIVQSDHHMLILVEWMHWPRVVRLGADDRPAEHLPEDMRSSAAIRSAGGKGTPWWWRRPTSWQRPGSRARACVLSSASAPTMRAACCTASRWLTPTMKRPNSGEFSWPKSDKRLYEYACHEGNYAMPNTLRGARVLEQKWIEKNGPPPARKAE